MDKRIIEINKKYHLTYKLEDFIGKDDEFISKSCTGTVLVDINTLVNNFSILKKLLILTKVNQINCLDYESALFLEENLEQKMIISLVDDYQNKNRSYIDMTKFIKHEFYIPLSYFMWGVKFKDFCNVHCLRLIEFDTMASINGDKKLYKTILEKIKEILKEMNTSNLSDLDKCILISNYLQSKVQYVEGGFESHADKIYVIDANKEEVTSEKVGSVNSVINENYGLCMAIANTTTLLLNNPIFNVNVRSVFGSGHVWNVATIDGKLYYIDNTWSITRNKNRVEGALKATNFTDDYLLFGQVTANNIGHHKLCCYIDGMLQSEDYDRDTISRQVKILSKQYVFQNYSDKLRFNSKIIK